MTARPYIGPNAHMIWRLFFKKMFCSLVVEPKKLCDRSKTNKKSKQLERLSVGILSKIWEQGGVEMRVMKSNLKKREKRQIYSRSK